MFLPDSRTLVVSDLHLEKGTSFGRTGIFLPPYDTRRTLKDVAAACDRYRPARVISLGDSFHDIAAEKRMDQTDVDTLAGLCASAEWVWILGNHDPLPPAAFPGRAVQNFTIDGLTFTHEPDAAETGWHVAGHLHPCARVSRGGRKVRRRCFVTDGTRLVMPAFGAFTGGLNVLEDAYEGLFTRIGVFMMGRDGVYQVPAKALCPDQQTSVFRG